MTNEKINWSKSLKFPLTFIVLIWIIHIVKVVFNLSLGQYGVYPREIFGLKGILLSPLIHANWGHLMSNSAPLLVLMVIIFQFYPKISGRVFTLIYIFTGLAVWLFGNPGEVRSFHIGASGVVYGLVSFVFWSGLFRRNLISIALALVVTLLYSGMFYGILPTEKGISWESHLYGALVGILVAYIYRHSIHAEEKKEKEWEVQQEKFFQEDPFA